MSQLVNASLANICDKVSYGYTTSAKNEPVGPKFLRITDIRSYFVDWESVPFCEASNSDRKKYKLGIGDICVARTGATTGISTVIKEDIDAVFASYLVRFQVNRTIADPFFIGYVLKSDLYKHYIDSIVGGSAQPNANATQLGEFEFSLPPLPTQQRIAQILGRLDDKIELNRRINRTLEAMAQALYKHHFVDFGPYQDGEFVESELGLIPRGWEVKPLSDLFDILSGGTPKTKIAEYWDGGIDWVAAKDVSSGTPFVMKTERTITPLGVKKSAAKLLPAFTTVITARGTVGEHALLSRDMTINQSNYGLSGKNGVGKFSTFLITHRVVEQLRQVAYGTVFDTITRKTFDSIKIASPSTEIWQQFENEIHPWFQEMLVNQQQTRKLAEIRDYLLPRLLSGEIEV